MGGASAQSLNASENTNPHDERALVSGTVPPQTPTDTQEQSNVPAEIVTKNESPSSTVNTNDTETEETAKEPKQPEPLISQDANSNTNPTRSTVENNDNPTTGNGISAEGDLNQYDNDYLKKVSGGSIASTLRKHFMVVPENHSAGSKRQQKIIQKVESATDKQLYAYGQNKTVDANTLKDNHKGTYEGCKHALAYTEAGTGGNLKTTKGYGNFLWEVCGREDSTQPKSGWFL